MSRAIDPELAARYDVLPRLDLADMSAIREAAPVNDERSSVILPEGVEERPLRVGAGAHPIQAVLYRPVGEQTNGILVHIHGGGFIAGSVHDPHTRRWCAQTAGRTGTAVLAVDYRLAPEHPYPAGHDDCLGAVRWAAEHRAAIGVAADAVILLHGQSAGGALAAGVALRLRDEGEHLLAGLLLDAPVTDDRLDTESMTTSRGGPVWTIDEATLSWRHYLDGRTPAPPYAAPARATSYAGLPATFISVNALDALRDEALFLGQRMATDGVDVDLRMYARTLHGTALIGMDIAAGEAINRDQYAAIRDVIDTHARHRLKEMSR